MRPARRSAKRLLGASQSKYLLDKADQVLVANSTVDIPVTRALTGQPVVVFVMRAASASASTVDGSITVSAVHSDDTTSTLGVIAGSGGSSSNNFHSTMHSGLMQAGDKALRIVSSGADASTVIVYRATIWKKVTGAVSFTGSSFAGGHPPQSMGPYASSVPGGPVFAFVDEWFFAASAVKSVGWTTPHGASVLPGKVWLSHTFAVGAQSFPMLVGLVGSGSATATYIIGGSTSDWIDVTVQAAMQDWGQS